MVKHDTHKRRRLGGLLILTGGALAATASIVVAAGVWGKPSSTQQTQPMELIGLWLGMRIVAADSSGAAELGVPPSVDGVVVAEVPTQADSSVLQAGLAPGDVVTRVNGNDVANLKDLYTLSATLDAGRPLSVDILRAGQPMTAVLPAAPESAAKQVAGFAAPGQQYGFAAPAQQYGFAAPAQQYGFAAPPQQYGMGLRARTPGYGPNCVLNGASSFGTPQPPGARWYRFGTAPGASPQSIGAGIQ
jgi:hypothetical protein